ncbi:hypothetical protein CIL05_00785 [Virgibacillus profundi]|uniref:SGNH hydrolase-type esterase domain-containing protein n=1 Tax=Virgibacillus profundi TaxID=2024555 RepID=A0A2A2IJE8_9BACI|nr:SGNH/GDSL hydrolase family protein [Virgibacillus profundi]PAV31225.1 hypothetical protein CIL05_00785 [Virgibacillus profundi]PXY55410.1 hypothetical protein CIT14_00790 [Virgibacillus profundi]
MKSGQNGDGSIIKDAVSNGVQENQINWCDPKEYPFDLTGFAWFQKEKIYRRFPKQPVAKLPDRVNELADCTSGGQIRFKTNTRKLEIKVTLSGEANMGHMSALGQCGFDVYVGEPGKQQYLSSAIPPLNEKIYESTLWHFGSKLDELLEVTINFPLYQGVEEVLVGIDPDAVIQQPKPYQTEKRAIFYGTSITQGGCASRPGMSYTNILSRRFPLEFINLGFSGSGKGEKEVALSAREIERPGCFVIDYEGNVNADQYNATLLPFIELYREWHPFVPIIVMSRIRYAKHLNDEQGKDYERRREISRSTVAELQRKGDKYISFLDGSQLLGENWHECTVDGVHPNDLGFMKMADGIEDVLRTSLEKGGVI